MIIELTGSDGATWRSNYFDLNYFKYFKNHHQTVLILNVQQYLYPDYLQGRLGEILTDFRENCLQKLFGAMQATLQHKPLNLATQQNLERQHLKAKLLNKELRGNTNNTKTKPQHKRGTQQQHESRENREVGKNNSSKEVTT